MRRGPLSVNCPYLKEQAAVIGRAMDDRKTHAADRAALEGVWHFLHAILDCEGAKSIEVELQWPEWPEPPSFEGSLT